jgi:two-component system, chemotaxis family, protein-glutamate methylesterase/glutaminase
MLVLPTPTRLPASLAVPAQRLVAMAASTGGPSALTQVLSRLPGDLPAAVVVVQHMPQGFTRNLAERLDSLCALRVREAQHGDPLMAGEVLIAPGGCQLRVGRFPGAAVVLLDHGPAVSSHRPSADVLFESAASAFGHRTVGVLLTGMGEDGATGLQAVRRAGGRTLAQDERSSVVFGMARVAVERGAVERVLPLDEIPEAVAAAARARLARLPSAWVAAGAASPR